MASVLDKAMVMHSDCVTAIQLNQSCFSCKTRKKCEMVDAYISMLKTKKKGARYTNHPHKDKR